MRPVLSLDIAGPQVSAEPVVKCAHKCLLLQGRNVVLESKYGSPRIVNDGVTVAKEVDLEDPVENIGAKLVRQVRVQEVPRERLRGLHRGLLRQ